MSIEQKEKTVEVLQDEPIIGTSPEAKRMRRALKKLAKIDSNVLIHGEPGVGKEFLARHIHMSSARRNRSFVRINCGSLGKTIDQKTLFGEELEGDSAVTRTVGLLEKAHKGVLYLDNISKLNQEFQEELLSVLGDGKFRKIGGRTSIDLDVRVISTDEEDVTALVERGVFSRELYHILNALTLRIPSLREHKQDVPELFNYFLNKFSAENNRELPPIDAEIFESILEYDWKGNVKELENTVQNLVVMSPEGELSSEFLPFKIKKHPFDFLEPRNLKGIVSDVEIYLIKKALNKFGGNQVKAAKLLGIPEATLRFKMKKYGLPKE